MGRIEDLRNVQDNWDSYGGKAPTEAAIKTAEWLMRSWGALNDGGVHLEAYVGGKEIEIEIGPDGTVCAMRLADAAPASV